MKPKYLSFSNIVTTKEEKKRQIRTDIIAAMKTFSGQVTPFPTQKAVPFFRNWSAIPTEETLAVGMSWKSNRLAAQ